LYANVSEEHTASIFRVEESNPEDGGNMFIRNVGSIFRTPHFSPEDGGSVFLRNMDLSTSPHGVTTHETNTDIFTA
jgi:hypothetical protein